MPDSQAMMNYCNDKVRCERKEPQPEGISEDKLSLIRSKHGASWETVFEIIFPRVPIPSPCPYRLNIS